MSLHPKRKSDQKRNNQHSSSGVIVQPTANFDWHVDDLLILKDLQTSNWQSPKENSPRSRGVTLQTPTTINSKEAAYNVR
jgi:hypothetical protein